MRLPGEPAKPPGPPLIHSFVMLGAVLAETEAVDRASSMGDGAWLTLPTWSGTLEGLRTSGVLIGGVDSFDAGWLFVGIRLLLLLLLLENFPAVCLVTAAAMPLASLAFFFSFLGIQAAAPKDLEQSPAPKSQKYCRDWSCAATPKSTGQDDAQSDCGSGRGDGK